MSEMTKEMSNKPAATPANAVYQFEDAVSDSDFIDLPSPPPSVLPQADGGNLTSMSPDLDIRSMSSRPRTVSRDGSGPMQCPTPDLQSVQGAYKNNVKRIERSAERLSLSEDIGEAIRQLREEQKLSDSRRSSIINPTGEEAVDRSALHRQLSYGYGSHASNSIVGTNSIARSGGFSPAGYYASPRGSFRSSRRSSVLGRSLSGSRLEEVAEPQQEGKPLDSPMSLRFTPLHTATFHEGSPLSSPTSSRFAPLLTHQEDGGEHDSPVMGGFAPPHAKLQHEPGTPLPIQDMEPSIGGLRIVNEVPYNLNDVQIPRTESPSNINEEEPRPSTDTARQVGTLWSDFDGVHTKNEAEEPTENDDDEAAALRQLTARETQERPRSMVHLGQSPGPPPGMVYYPAPVPMMLNLPKRLSKMPPNALRDQRRSQMLIRNGAPDHRRSGPLLDSTIEVEEGQRGYDDIKRDSTERKRRSTLPPQLRATLFFDQPATNQEVEVKGGSAVETLDSILDASAFAPVSAFTDHPIVGQAGADIYRASARAAKSSSQLPYQVRERNGSGNLLTKRNSLATLLDDSKSRHSLLSVGNYFGRRKSKDLSELEQDEMLDKERAWQLTHQEDYAEHHEIADVDLDEDTEGQHPLLDDDDEDELPFGDQPTTLLAELQMRKKQQKSRNKTAATSYPDGMQSTLLQLDAVAQIEARTRKEKRTRLAWEDPTQNDEADPSLGNEDDVPLGVLYPTQKMRRELEERPRGLIAQRQIEDNEPLSHRRARLRGEDPMKLVAMQQQQLEQMQAEQAALLQQQQQEEKDDSDEDHSGETLGQRLKRLKATQIPTNPSRVSGDFTSEIMSQFGGPPVGKEGEQQGKARGVASPPAPAAEEEEETLGQRRRRLQAEAAAKAPIPEMNKRRSMADLLAVHPSGGTGVRAVSGSGTGLGMEYVPAPRTRNTSWAMQLNEQAGRAGRGLHNGRTGGGGGLPHPIMAGNGVEVGRKDMVDRWRMSVLN